MDEVKIKISKKNILFIGIFIIIIIGVIGVLSYEGIIKIPYLSLNQNSNVPAKKISGDIIELTADCEDCFKISQVSDNFVKQNNITLRSTNSYDYKSESGQSTIEKYKITKVPSFILISNDVNNIKNKEGLTLEKDYAVFEKGVPYIDLSNNEVKGVVTITEIYDPTCKDCVSLSPLKSKLEALGIKVKDYNAIESTSEQGKNLIKNNNLNFIPTLLISKNIEEYWWIFNNLKQTLTKTGDYYLYTNPVPPYKDLKTGTLKGIVDITYITDKTCTDCYDVKKLKASFTNYFGIFIKNEKSVDISSEEGKALIQKYKITKVPTAILSKEVSDYTSLKKVMEGIGTYDSDGSFVYTNLDQLQVKYKTLS